MLAKPTPHDGILKVDDWAKAQDYANFILLRPKEGSGWRIDTPTVRGESARIYSSLRFNAERAKLRFRLKMTLNDWWVPVSNDVNLRRVTGHVLVGDEAVFLGKDYHGKPGACGQVLGTTVEAYAPDGTPTGDDWRDLYASLEAAVPAAVAESRKLSFAERSYWMRWNRDAGPWDSHEFTAPHWMRPDPNTFETVASLIQKSRHEMQVLFRQPMTLNYTSWGRTVEPPEPQGPVAPRDPRYPKLAKKADVRGHDVSFAALEDAVGPWFFAWQEQGRQEELHLRAKKGLDEKRALATVQAIMTAKS